MRHIIRCKCGRAIWLLEVATIVMCQHCGRIVDLVKG